MYVQILFPQHDEDPIAGYLSLHKSNESMLLKWTPNKLMSGSCEREKSQFWDYALTVNLHDIVYIHCHQHGNLFLLITGLSDTSYCQCLICMSAQFSTAHS